jgi:quercetin dioxygenase-like cupin family protein
MFPDSSQSHAIYSDPTSDGGAIDDRHRSSAHHDVAGGISVSPSGHTYLRTHLLSGPLMGFDLKAEDLKVRNAAATARSRRASKTLVKEGSLRIVLVAIAKGGALARHLAGGSVSIHVLRGSLILATQDGTAAIRSGELIVLEAGLVHGVTATTDASILITISAQERGSV